jgi:hypothetical protein
MGTIIAVVAVLSLFCGLIQLLSNIMSVNQWIVLHLK